MVSLKLDYKTNKSELCEIGQKYDTDKSSMRYNVTDSRHCHPYTLFYNSLFKSKKNEKLQIAELGILEGASLLMWNEYFTNANLYGFEYDYKLIKNFKDTYKNNNIQLSHIDVTDKNSIQSAFNKLNIMYDIIIEDTTHQFDDQIRVIENIYQYLKPGGILIIEDIFKRYNENDYINRLKPILEHFQDYYFVELDHVNKNSTGWDNDKLFILIKNGAEPIFKNNNKMTIITPSYRTNNLITLKNSINFDYVDEWIIVYDGSKISENPNIFSNENNDKIKEYIYKGEGVSGNPQRNYALSIIKNTDTFIYYLDDDNIIHPSLYKLMNIVDKNKMYSFDQENGIKGNTVARNHIDSAMVLIHYKLCDNIKWNNNEYGADGYYMEECYNNNKDNYIYVNNDICYYNKLGKTYKELEKERRL
jgi:predicted O-methyltransferase YrrM